VGCGVGRILDYLAPDAIGVDTNTAAVAHCRSLGFDAYLPNELEALAPEPFDALVLAHVLEHLEPEGARALLGQYLHYLNPRGQVVIICPQERGYRSDPTHVHWYDLVTLRTICQELGLAVTTARSFPLPRWVGRFFVYNEFVVVASNPGAAPT
jgi:SAM-dependent methyltransferase